MKLTNVMTWIAAAVVTLGVTAGCQDENQNGFFKGEGVAGERVAKFADVQAANGARNDAMLYPRHFEGGHLNSLGRQKVLLMLTDCDNCDPVVVHMVNCGDGEILAQRKASVEMYLKTVEGPNLLTFHPAAPDLIRFNKTESGKADEGAGSGTAEQMSMGVSSK
jgi:hypothetical protein